MYPFGCFLLSFCGSITLCMVIYNLFNYFSCCCYFFQLLFWSSSVLPVIIRSIDIDLSIHLELISKLLKFFQFSLHPGHCENPRSLPPPSSSFPLFCGCAISLLINLFFFCPLYVLIPCKLFSFHFFNYIFIFIFNIYFHYANLKSYGDSFALPDIYFRVADHKKFCRY